MSCGFFSVRCQLGNVKVQLQPNPGPQLAKRVKHTADTVTGSRYQTGGDRNRQTDGLAGRERQTHS